MIELRANIARLCRLARIQPRFAKFQQFALQPLVVHGLIGDGGAGCGDECEEEEERDFHWGRLPNIRDFVRAGHTVFFVSPGRAFLKSDAGHGQGNRIKKAKSS